MLPLATTLRTAGCCVELPEPLRAPTRELDDSLLRAAEIGCMGPPEGKIFARLVGASVSHAKERFLAIVSRTCVANEGWGLALNCCCLCNLALIPAVRCPASAASARSCNGGCPRCSSSKSASDGPLSLSATGGTFQAVFFVDRAASTLIILFGAGLRFASTFLSIQSGFGDLGDSGSSSPGAPMPKPSRVPASTSAPASTAASAAHGGVVSSSASTMGWPLPACSSISIQASDLTEEI
mmetsp:Transcript_112436/g.195026  ORF Transcript_112436/g.195026 Transcript_112436/m.195026 type:complete len:239 (+) Transcript_112436:538-1254(+)